MKRRIANEAAITTGQAGAPMKFTDIKRSEIGEPADELTDELTGTIDMSEMVAAQVRIPRRRRW